MSLPNLATDSDKYHVHPQGVLALGAWIGPCPGRELETGWCRCIAYGPPLGSPPADWRRQKWREIGVNLVCWRWRSQCNKTTSSSRLQVATGAVRGLLLACGCRQEAEESVAAWGCHCDTCYLQSVTIVEDSCQQSLRARNY